MNQNHLLLLKLHELPWYLMTRQQQLSYGHLLNGLQNGSVLRMGPFAVLNFEILSDVIQFCIQELKKEF